MGEIEDGSSYMMYQNADLKDLHSTDGSSYGYVQSDPVTYATSQPEAGTKTTNGDDAKELTELEKYWKAVKDNPHDFTGWTYLLQYVEQENNLDSAREAFQEFFRNYPYCYGYWKKYADLEKKNENIDKCLEVFEEGVTAIPLSVDLWQHYIAFCRAQYPEADGASKVRALFEKAIKATGLEFRSDRLWEMYVTFELEQQNYRNAMIIFDRIISTPTQLYSHQFDKLEEFIRTYPPQDILDSEELSELLREVATRGEAAAKDEAATVDTSMTSGDADVATTLKIKVERETASDEASNSAVAVVKPADTVEPMTVDADGEIKSESGIPSEVVKVEPKTAIPASIVAAIIDEHKATDSEESAKTLAAGDMAEVPITSVSVAAVGTVDALATDIHIKEEDASHSHEAESTTAAARDPKLIEDENNAVRELLIEKRRVVHKANEEEVGKRWTFEEGIKRPYFHVKPLERTQLNNWREYLDYEIEAGNQERVCILFERCLIACALYEDMWLKYAKYLETRDEAATRDVYRRACMIHLTQKPNIQLMWASYEEKTGQYGKSAEVLDQMEKNFPGYLPITFRRINLARRQNNHAQAELLYKQYAEAAKSPQIASLYALKQARFRHKLLHDESGAVKILNEALINDKDNARLYMQLIDIYYQTTPIKEDLVVKAFDGALHSDMAIEAKILFAQRKVEFLEDLGLDINRLQDAYNDLNSFVKMGTDKRKRALEEESEDVVAKRARTEVNGVTPTATTTAVAATDQTAAYGYNWASYAQNYNYQNAWSMYGQQYYSQQ